MPTEPDANLILIGLRGSGKSTIGRLLAERLGRPLVDLDAVTLGLLGVASASEAFRALGEGAFRRAELAALERTLAVTGQVVALGGGTPTAPGAAELLRGQAGRGLAWIVYLRADPETLRARLAVDPGDRPPLVTGSKHAADDVDTIYGLRDPLYRGVASSVHGVAGIAAEEVAAGIAAEFEGRGPGGTVGLAR